jgi:hypothetical protein
MIHAPSTFTASLWKMTPFNSATSPGRSGTEGGNDIGKGLICATAESLTGFAPDAKFAAHYGQGFRPFDPVPGAQFSSLRGRFTPIITVVLIGLDERV